MSWRDSKQCRVCGRAMYSFDATGLHTPICLECAEDEEEARGVRGGQGRTAGAVEDAGTAILWVLLAGLAVWVIKTAHLWW